jgi:predicted solute-binding protein
MLHGPQRGLFDLEFRAPSGCADALASGAADIGIVPSIELARQDLDVLRGTGIACHGPVRSILLISRRPAAEIRTLAADTSSRTSIQLARVALAERYGATPAILPHPPDLEAMMNAADACVVIGDPALHIDPASLPWHVYDLGAEWQAMTGLPMVFAVWAARKGVVTDRIERAFLDSWRYGRERIGEIVVAESAARGLAPCLVEEYLTRRIVFELGEREYAGMNEFLRLASGRAAPAAGMADSAVR